MRILEALGKGRTANNQKRGRAANGQIFNLALSLWFLALIAVCFLAVGVSAHSDRSSDLSTEEGFAAHEWGTFTSIAGDEGQAVEWLPQTGSTDLPEFIGHLQGAALKGGLRGTVRMETPVLYFYASQPSTVSVHVSLKNGLITEWYPDVSKATPSGDLRKVVLAAEGTRGDVWWNSVHLEPSSVAEYPKDEIETHYYAARETTSTPLRIAARAHVQREKFLFYRGVADIRVPVTATSDRNGSVTVQNRGTDEIPNVILFERRGEHVGYRIGGPLEKETVLQAPELTSSVYNLPADLEGMLVARGLYPDEAHAMVQTWRDSWFEEGSRIFYIVPEAFLNSTLPLDIHPSPAQLIRVFVGRIEVVTPATRQEIETALASHDGLTVNRFGRFLMPILYVMGERDPQRAKQLQDSLVALER
jgi:hypothetical protein